MSQIKTIGDLQKILDTKKAPSIIHPKFTPNDVIPTHHLGVDVKGLTTADKIQRPDLKKILSYVPNNPFLQQRRVALGLIPKTATVLDTKTIPRIMTNRTVVHTDMVFGAFQPIMTGAPPAGGGRPSYVDWRTRWGVDWITSIRDQNGCELCWDFAATALIEAMVRINHATWTIRSEGDVERGMGMGCGNGGSSSAALDWIKTNGIADPDCFPFTAADKSYTPTADRSGRTVKIYDYTSLGNIDDQKAWLDSTGPLVTYFDVFHDFDSLGNQVYHKTDDPSNYERGWHAMLVIGYDDSQNCWIVKNSWGTGWGDNGFCRIGYGEASVDLYPKLGVTMTNPDPWTKRRLHNGNLYESGDGALHRNFEMVATANGNQITHWWRNNDTSGFPWAVAETFGNDIAPSDWCGNNIAPTLIGTTYNRNFELVYLTTSNRLHHWWFDQSGGRWNDGGIFGPLDAAGVPGFIQGNYNAPGNFEVVVRTSDSTLNHWWRDGSGWHDGGHFGIGVMLSGASLVQSQFGSRGNFELVCVTNSGQMQHWWRNNDASGFPWNAGPTFGSGVDSPPCMIEGQYGAINEFDVGNFELCVAVGGMVQHWWRDNHARGYPWSHSATFGHDVKSVVGLLEGSFGFNLEVIVVRTDNKLQHYWRDGGGWHEGPIIGNT